MGIYMKKRMIVCFMVFLVATISFSGCLDKNDVETMGDRVWNEGMSTTYTWDARSFSGFHYDLNTGQGKEYMTITNIGRIINTGDIYYQTTISDMSFEYSEWGVYKGIGFMGDKYFTDSDSTNRLSKVLIDESENGYNRIYFPGQYIALEEGYSVKVNQIDTKSSNVFLALEKDGEIVTNSIVNNSNPTFIYEKEISGKTIPIIMIYVNGIYTGTENSIMTIGGIFQISDNLVKLENGTKIDCMTINNIGGNTIKMVNHELINLSKGSEVILMGKVKFLVADSNTLRFMPAIENKDSNAYEICGTVSDFSNPEYIVKKWTLQNFEGIHYDINNTITESESINVNSYLDDSIRKINTSQMSYIANTTPVSYEYSDWETYTTIDFMGERYYVGVNGSLLDSGSLSKVLIDTVEKKVMYMNQPLILKEGVSVKVEQLDIDGNKAYIIVEKDGKEIGSQIVKAGDSINYSTKIAGSGRESFIKIQIDSVFKDDKNSFVTISGIFQASENLTTIKKEDWYGKMRIKEFNQKGIVLENTEEIILTPGSYIEFMNGGNKTFYFKVGDNTTLRYAPVVEYEIV